MEYELDEDELAELYERTQIWEQLRAAFAARQRPGELLAHSCVYTEDVARAVSGKNWDELAAVDLLQIRMDLRCLLPEAFWYFFPAFVRHCLFDTEEAGGPGFWVVWVLTPPPEDRLSSFDELVRPLSLDERAAVTRFVRWYSDGESYLDGRERLLAFWSS
ncbi:hypothetical protein [Streptomyces sp. NPDC049879]|uniref:hypothetical protein n=1 Tax=Streptomyces sp. NPDC049879 TaxID=3365598 RepID=UPI00379172B3